MKLFESIKTFSILLMVAIVIGFFGCGEDEETPVKPAKLDSTPVAVETPGGDPTVALVKIVWIEIDKNGEHIKVEGKFEPSSPTKEQNVIVVKTIGIDDKGNEVPATGVRVEWILNTRNGAVGDIVETDDPGHQDVPAAPKVLGAVPQIKVDNKFAFTFTNNKDETPLQLKGLGPNGTNVTIKEGETWIVITSVSEGYTDITAFAPAIPRDKTHKIFAVKHWTDYKLTVLTPKQTCINYCSDRPSDANTEELVSIVTKRDGTLVDGTTDRIKVVYTINIKPGDPNAVWDKNDTTRFEILPIDAQGEARATIKLKTLPEPSEAIFSNTVKVEAFRPPKVDEKDYVLVAASEDVTKPWGSEFLSIDMTCPKGNGPNGAFYLNDSVIFKIIVNNEGNCPAENVKVTLKYPSEAFSPAPPQEISATVGKPVSVELKAKKESPKEDPWKVTVNAESKRCVKANPVICPITIVGLPDLVLECKQTKVKRNDMVEEVVYTNTIELIKDDPEDPEGKKNAVTITLMVKNREDYAVEGGYNLTVTLLDIVEYVRADPSPDKSGGKTITWNTPTIEASKDKFFTFIVKGIETGGPTDITVKLSKVKEEQPDCDISIQVFGLCNVIPEYDKEISVQRNESKPVPFMLNNKGLKDATFNLEDAKVPNGLELIGITYAGITYAKPEDVPPIKIPTRKSQTFIITLKGIEVRQTVYSVTVDGKFDCEIGKEFYEMHETIYILVK